MRLTARPHHISCGPPALLHAIDQHSPTDQNGDKNGVVSRFYRDDQLKLVANLPYNIASPLVVELLLYGIELLAFTVQKEVADRLRAAPGSEAYGPLSVVVQTLADVEVLDMSGSVVAVADGDGCCWLLDGLVARLAASALSGSERGQTWNAMAPATATTTTPTPTWCRLIPLTSLLLG